MVSVLVAIANGSEEIETLTPVDFMRRAGAQVTLAAIGDSPEVTMSRQVKVVADTLLSNVASQAFDLIVIPGGQPGANNMRDDPMLIEMLQRQKAEGRWIGSICASPAVVLKTHGIIDNEPATCYPSVESKLTNQSQISDRVVKAGKIVTSRGPGTAMEFSLELIGCLFGEEKRGEIGRQALAAGY